MSVTGCEQRGAGLGRRAVGLLLAVVVGCGGEPVGDPAAFVVPAGARHWSFDDDPVDNPPLAFDCPVGRWVVENASSGHTIAQRQLSADDDFNMAIATDAAADDLRLSVRLQSVAGDIDQGGGLMWRVQGPRDYYIARWNPLERNYRVYTVKDGVRRQLDSAQVEADPGVWHELSIAMTGDRIQCQLDGRVYLEVVDSSFPNLGRVGLWTKADAVTRFDDLMLSSTDAD